MVLICQGCVVSTNDGRPPLSIFFCRLEKHYKPSPDVVGEALEKWIPSFKMSGLGCTLGYWSINGDGIPQREGAHQQDHPPDITCP